MDCNQPPAHHGLLNQGATCYLNSVLQVLFMTKDFREAVERHTRENPGTEYIDLQLKHLFVDLQQHIAYTYKVTEKLGIDNVYEQRDAAEYFEKILSLTSPDASQIFHGECTNKTTCSKCGKYEDVDGYFWHLPLGLDWNSKDYSVVAGVEQYFQTSYFNGEDQLYCDQCDSKCDATIKSVMKHHPEVLTLLLKRFDFDYSYMMYVKNNRAVDIPFTLQIPENQTYELYAVVDHFGDLRGGHYTATIKSQDDERWYEFNDASVTLINCPLFQGNNSEKVYLLFYKKTKTHVAETCTHGIINDGSPPATRDKGVQDAEEVMEQEEGEKRTDVGNDDSAGDVSMDIDEAKQMMENQSSHLCDYVFDVHPEKPQQNDRNILKDDEEERGQNEVAEQSEQNGLLLIIDQPKERVEDENNGDRQMMRNLYQGWNGESSHLGNYSLAAQGEKPKQEKGDVVKDNQERHKTGAEEQAEQGEVVLTNSQLKERVEDQENDNIHRRPDIHHEFKPETSDRHARQDHLDKEDRMSEEREEGQVHESRSHSVCDYVLDAHTEKQPHKNKGKTLKDGEKGGHTGADEQVEQTGLFPSDDQPEDRVEDQDFGDTWNNEDIHNRPDANHECKAESSDRYAILDPGVRQVMQNTYQGSKDESSEQRDDVQLETSYRLAGHEHVCHEDEMSETLRGAVNIKIASVEPSQGDEEEMKEKSSLENPLGDTECKTTERLDSVRKNLNTNQANKQEVGQKHNPQHVSVNEKEEMREIEDKSDRDRQTGAHQQTLGKRLYTKYDLCYQIDSEDKKQDEEDNQEGMTGGDKQTLGSRTLLRIYDLSCQGPQGTARVGNSERYKQGDGGGLDGRHEQQKQEEGNETSTSKHYLSDGLRF